MIYGYARVSTKEQRIDRQIKTLTERYDDIIIFKESYTGKTMNRPQWQRLMNKVKEGDTIVFDEISRMSRNAQEGYQTYFNLMEKGINLVFIKESTLNTENFRNVCQIAKTGTDADCIIEGVNKYLMLLAQRQIESAFKSAQSELEYRAVRQAEGIAVEKQKRIENNQPMWGGVKGQTAPKTKEKQEKAIEKIKKYSRRYDGEMNDTEVMKLVEVSRGSFYRYVKMIEGAER